MALGRELTQKNRQSESSESDDDDEGAPVLKNENPWLGSNSTGDPLDEVFSGYKKFWEEHNANEKKMKKLKKDSKKSTPVVIEEQHKDDDEPEVSEPESSQDEEEEEDSDDENPSKFINDLFDEAEDKINTKMETKLIALKPKLLLSEGKSAKKKQVKKKRGSNVHDANYLGFEKKAKLGDVDESLIQGKMRDDNVEDETTHIPSKVLLKEVKQKKEAKKNFMRGNGEINPDSFLSVKSKHLITAVPKSQDLDDADDEFEVNQLSKANKLSLAEAFENDDIVNDFEQEVEDEAKKNLNDDDTILPGWGNWGGHGVNAKKHKFERKAPQYKKKDRIIISTTPNEKLQKHLISSVPFPFKSVQEFEASMRLPIGRDFIPETAHQKLTLSSVVTKAGTIIEPMTEDILVKNGPAKTNKFMKSNKKGKKFRK